MIRGSHSLLTVASLIALVGCGQTLPESIVEAEASLPSTVEFNRHVKPILSDRCFSCHGPDANARKTEMRLDTPDGASVRLTESPRSRAIVPGNPAKSEIVRRLVSADPEYRMPPPESNHTVTDSEIATLVRWIEQGAEYQPHWSLIPPVRSEFETEKASQESLETVDGFVGSVLNSKGLEFSGPASREELIRRVSFDLTGLPPTLHELDDFLNDDGDTAFERVVDRLLDSQAYGERMAADWLDLARYADSHGYQDDGMRNMWPWRDWVISAFNQNMPYDEFVTWQLAGDLLPEPTQDQRLATGFNRNHLQSQEGGIVPEEFRVDYVADRTNTFGKAFLGMTVECARCHDHKFDSISQEDYYQLFAFFNSVNEFGNIPYAGEASPTVVLVDTLSQVELDQLRERIAALESETNPQNADFDSGFENWLTSLDQLGQIPSIVPEGLIGHYPLEGFDYEDDQFNFANLTSPDDPGYYWGDTLHVPVAVSGVNGDGLRLSGDGWLDMGPDRYYFERNEPFSISLAFYVENPETSGALFTKSGGLFNGLRGYLCLLNEDGSISVSLNHVFPDNSIEIRTSASVESGKWHRIVVTYDGSSRAEGIDVYLDDERLASTTVVDNLKQSIVTTINPATGDSTFWGGQGNLRIGFVSDNQPYLSDVRVDDFRVFDRRLTYLEARSELGFEDDLSTWMRSPRSEWSDEQNTWMREYYVSVLSDAYPSSMQALTAVRARENEILTHLPDVMVLRDLPEPRATYVLDRGSYDAPTTQVQPGTPASIAAFPEDLPKNRLGLATWLFDKSNPLTARVAVNRLWQQVFGRGLVGTSDNFGSQGQMPSHPELLDWLALKFVEEGWDIKKSLKRMVMSATYQQSSIVAPEMFATDPENMWLARGPSYRYPAEMIRDNALAVSGLLVPEIGGPSVRPYQPAGLWKELATRNETEYVQDHGDALYRRSMYTIWKRTTPPPSMMSFDASERNLCTVNRQSTNTPLQALVLMNDPQFIEASRLLAERAYREGGSTISDRIDYAFRLATSRFPSPAEQKILLDLYQKELARYQSDLPGALALLDTGEYPRDTNLNASEVAAFSVVGSTLLNFDAAIMKR